MASLPASLENHRVHSLDNRSVVDGVVLWSPAKSLWFLGMAGAALAGGLATISFSAVAVFLLATAFVLLFGHSLGSHRKLIHDSYRCPKWLEYFLVWCGVQVGLAGPIGLLRQHELRDYAQRLPECHDYLRHGRAFWQDAWWQLNCELHLDRPPHIEIEPRVAEDRFYRFLERTWMLQQLPPALLLYVAGGWAFVFWGCCARVTAGVFGHWLIGYFAHNHGGMHHHVDAAAVQGRNIGYTSLLTMGESWHNNHHAFPGSARLGLYDGEWDPGWWMLVLMRRVGLVSHFRLPEHLPARPELRALDKQVLAPPIAGAAVSASTSGIEVFVPGVLLSERRLRRIAGPAATVHRSSANTRFVAFIDGVRHEGLTALCELVARRSRSARLATRWLMPAAGVLDRLRPSAA